MVDIFVQKQAMHARLSCTTTPILSVNTWSGRSEMNATQLSGNKPRQNTPGGWTDTLGAIHWFEISFRGACTWLWFRMFAYSGNLTLCFWLHNHKPKTVIGCFGCIGYILYLHTTVGGRDRVPVSDCKKTKKHVP